MLKSIMYILWQWSWGILQTALGFVLFIKYRKCKHYNYHGACVTVWSSKSSVSLGQFIFLSDDPFCYYQDQKKKYTFDEFNEQLLIHEYGHTIQSLILGPLYLLIIGLPSMLWSFLPVCARMREQGVSYFDFYCESSANALGEWVTKKKSIGNPLAEQEIV